ncbi:MAG TPA: peptide chain release factor 1 [bacterium]|jgi:peptide chain release factor 1|nr:peptide chain release factor 1 [bacterium]
MQERLESLEAKYESLTRELMDPEVQAQSSVFVEKAKRHADLEQVVGLIKRRRELESHLGQAQEMARSGEAEMVAMAREEIAALESERDGLDEALKLALLPKDPADGRPVYVEIRPGTGGDEAALFAGVLLRMYTRYSEARGWGVELISAVEGEVGGFKEAILLIKGAEAWRLLKNEAGVHRVQRVPVTEAGGRIHTSTATVMVLPEAEPRDMSIDERDLKWETFQSSGAGGQSVNTTYSAVRLTHMPSGVVVSMQDERSQLKNRDKALKVLASRLQARERERQEAEASATRRAQVGSGDRSEKIRTYNYPQNRVTDHRVGLSVHNLSGVVDGGLQPFLEALLKDDQQRALAALAPV